MKQSKHITYALFAIITSFVISCGQKKEEPKQQALPPARNVEMDVPSGTKAPAIDPVDTIPGQTHVKITCRCLAAVNPDDLDALPRDLSSARRDTAMLRKINQREVFVVQPGESGYILAKSDDRLQVRFPDKIVWVMISDTK